MDIIFLLPSLGITVGGRMTATGRDPAQRNDVGLWPQRNRVNNVLALCPRRMTAFCDAWGSNDSRTY